MTVAIVDETKGLLKKGGHCRYVEGGGGGGETDSHINRMRVLIRNFEKKRLLRGTKILFCGHGLKGVPILKQHIISCQSLFSQYSVELLEMNTQRGIKTAF